MSFIYIILYGSITSRNQSTKSGIAAEYCEICRSGFVGYAIYNVWNERYIDLTTGELVFICDILYSRCGYMFLGTYEREMEYVCEIGSRNCNTDIPVCNIYVGIWIVLFGELSL